MIVYHRRLDPVPGKLVKGFARSMGLPSFWAEDGFHDDETGDLAPPPENAQDLIDRYERIAALHRELRSEQDRLSDFRHDPTGRREVERRMGVIRERIKALT